MGNEKKGEKIIGMVAYSIREKGIVSLHSKKFCSSYENINFIITTLIYIYGECVNDSRLLPLVIQSSI